MRTLNQALRWILLLVSFLCFSCKENTVDPERYGTIQGEVVDSRNNKALANVSLTTTPGTSSFVTDVSGSFVIDNVKVGTYSLVARKTDYRSETININVAEGTPTVVRIVLDAATTSNVAPNAPFAASPADQATEQATDLTLGWRMSDPNGKADSLRCDVVLYESNSSNRLNLLSNSRDSTVRVTGLRYNTTYFWQVTVRDKAGLVTRGDIWSFRTRNTPDNSFLYVREVNGNTDIYSSDAAGATQMRLTSSPFVEAYPRFSPLYDRIAYASNATGQYRLYTMNRDGSDQRLVSPLPVEGYHNYGIGYCWSPDGSQLLFAQNDKLWRINRDGSGLAQVATAPLGRNFRECDWTSQGNRIIVQTVGASIYDSELNIMNADGSNMVEVVGNLPGRVDSPSFNLLGTRIMYTQDADAYVDATGRQTNAQIITQTLSGADRVVVSLPLTTLGKPSGYNDLLPRYAPNGAKILFVQVNNVNQSVPEIWQVDTDGRNRLRLFQNATHPDSK